MAVLSRTRLHWLRSPTKTTAWFDQGNEPPPTHRRTCSLHWKLLNCWLGCKHSNMQCTFCMFRQRRYFAREHKELGAALQEKRTLDQGCHAHLQAHPMTPWLHHRRLCLSLPLRRAKPIGHWYFCLIHGPVSVRMLHVADPGD